MEVTTPAASNGQPAFALAASEGCATCGAQLAADQRYCVECGDRRGQPRLSFMDGRARSAPAPTVAPRRRRRPSGSAGATLVAGVGTLVLALGVGVLIGRTGTTAPVRSAAPVQVVTVGGGSAAADASQAATDTTTTKTSSHDKSAAADKVLKSKVKLAPSTVTVGSSCKGGAGCRGGTFTGDFFGP